MHNVLVSTIRANTSDIHFRGTPTDQSIKGRNHADFRVNTLRIERLESQKEMGHASQQVTVMNPKLKGIVESVTKMTILGYDYQGWNGDAEYAVMSKRIMHLDHGDFSMTSSLFKALSARAERRANANSAL